MNAQSERGKGRKRIVSYVLEDIKSRRERYIRVDAMDTVISQGPSNICTAISIKKPTILAPRIVETRTYHAEHI